MHGLQLLKLAWWFGLHFIDTRWWVGIHAYNNDLRSLSKSNGVIMAYLQMTPTFFGGILFLFWFFPHMIFLSEALSDLYCFSCFLLDFLILSLRWPLFDLPISFFFGLWHWLGLFGLWLVLLWFSLFCFWLSFDCLVQWPLLVCHLALTC
jgi:hypothetical protein